MGWAVIAYPELVPNVPRPVARDERVQADHLIDMIDAFEAAGVHAASVYAFIQPDAPHSPDLRQDHDMASYGIVKVIRERFDDPASPYRWEPKAAFHALAERYARARASQP